MKVSDEANKDANIILYMFVFVSTTTIRNIILKEKNAN